MDKFCCINCFSIREIKKFIEDEATIGDCNYCGSKGIYICDVENVGSFIMERIERHYEDAVHEVGYDSSEGGYLLPTSDIADVLIDEEDIFGQILEDPYPLLNDLVPIDGTPYVRKDPYGPLSGDPEEIRYWENFCKIVKREQRFTIFLPTDKDDRFDHSRPKDFLFYLAERFMPTLIGILPAGTIIYRARIQKVDKNLKYIDLTSPPAEQAKNSRMSPAGISFFYGGMDFETCVHEILPEVGENVIVGKFEVLRNLLILDLSTEIESRKSIFDPEYVFSYEEYFKPFLVHFVSEISKPIRKTDNEIEYIPTQVFTEFIKSLNFKNQWFYPDDKGREMDVFLNGILFRSSIRKGGTNVVLFRGPDISTTRRGTQDHPWLLYKGNRRYQITEIQVSSIVV